MTRPQLQENSLERAGEVNPGHSPQRPLDLEKRFQEILEDALWLRLGGYLQVELSGDVGARGNPFALQPSKLGQNKSSDNSGFVPLGSDARLSFRRSRLFLDAYSPLPESIGGLRTYLEVDYSGSHGEVNLRHAYVATRYLVVGRTNSAFKDPAAEPESVDPAGPNARLGLRQQGVRLVVPVGEDSFSLAFEDPGPGIAPDGSDLSDDRLVRKFDLATHYRHNLEWGHLQFSAVRRNLSLRDANASSARFIGWGLALSGQYFVHEKDQIQFELAGGPGLGRYLNDLSGTSSELGVDRWGRTDVQTSWGGFLAYQHWFDDQTRLNVQGGVVGIDLLSGQPPESLRQSYKVSVNLMKDLNQDVRVGLEVGHGWRRSFDGTLDSGGRLAFMVRYGF